MVSLILGLLISVSAAATESLACDFAPTIHGEIPFNQVELISRDPRVGLWRGGAVKLKPWIGISDAAILGIDREGRVMNIITMPGRTVGFVLSGERKIKDIFLLKPGRLLAIDSTGELLEYRFDEKETKFVGGVAKRAVKRYVRDLCMAGAGLATFAATGSIGWDSAEMLVGAGLALSASGFIEGFRGAVEFETLNERAPDGFRPLGVQIPDFRSADYAYSDGVIRDYLIQLKGGGATSLMALIAEKLGEDPAVNFDKTCEHDLIPRGIPPENYEPKWGK